MIKPLVSKRTAQEKTQLQKSPPRKGVRADPLADGLFSSRRAGFRCKAAVFFILRSVFLFRIVDNLKNFFGFS